MRNTLLGFAAAAGLTLAAALPPTPLSSAEKTTRTDAILKRFVDEFVPLTPGQGQFPASFLMGSDREGQPSEKPAHQVTLRAPFAMAKYEVTQELYEAVMGTNPSRWKGPRNSVEKVTWAQADEFCRKVTAELRRLKLLKEGEVIRLPSEAEWEDACRAGTTTPYSFGAEEAKLTDYAWYKANAKGNDPPVGKKRPNAWGLYDMHGYVWEYCADAWHRDYEGAPADGTAWDGGGEKQAHVIRGGAWTSDAGQCRSAARLGVPADEHRDDIGFRCVRAASKKGS